MKCVSGELPAGTKKLIALATSLSNCVGSICESVEERWESCFSSVTLVFSRIYVGGAPRESRPRVEERRVIWTSGVVRVDVSRR